MSKQVMFFHVPKTGGVSILDFLRKQSFFYPKPELYTFDYHTPLFVTEKILDINQFHKITVVRNPYRRTYSLYKACIKKLIKEVGYASIDISNFCYKEFLIYCRLQGSKHSSIVLNNAGNATFDQSFYVVDSSGNLNIEKLYKLENINEFETDFNTKLPELNAGTYTEQEYLDTHTSDVIQSVKYLYYRDFDLFNYSTHFDDSFSSK